MQNLLYGKAELESAIHEWARKQGY